MSHRPIHPSVDVHIRRLSCLTGHNTCAVVCHIPDRMLVHRMVICTRWLSRVVYTYIAVCVNINHRSSRCSMTRSSSPGPGLPDRVRMPAGTIGLYKPANRTTRRRQTGALEDSCSRCTFTHMHPSHVCYDRLHLCCIQSHMSSGVLPYPASQPLSVGMTELCPPIYICILIPVSYTHLTLPTILLV